MQITDSDFTLNDWRRRRRQRRSLVYFNDVVIRVFAMHISRPIPEFSSVCHNYYAYQYIQQEAPLRRRATARPRTFPGTLHIDTSYIAARTPKHAFYT